MTTPPEALREMGADFIYAADALAETMRHLEQGMEARLKFLRRCVTENTDRLAKLKEEIGTLPEQIAKWDAEAARLESQTAEDLLRQALEAGRQEQPAPEPFRPGLPPERLRKVWAEWEQERGPVYKFDGQSYQVSSDPSRKWYSVTGAWEAGYRPHGKTRAEVEAMADAAEKPKCPACGKKPDRDTRPLSAGEYVTCQSCGLYLRVVDGAWQIVRPVENCGHVAADGTCGHPNALTPECHDGVVCPVKAEKPVATPQPKGKRAVVMVGDLPYYADSVAFDTKGKLIKGESVPFGLPPTPPAPTLLDLTKLPPGTVCEATGQIARGSHVILPGERFAFAGSPTELLARVRVIERDESFDVPTMVHARVVKVPR